MMTPLEIGLPLVVLALGVAVQVPRWAKGQADPAFEGIFAGVRHVPRRYFHDVHEVVSRHRPSARMHVLAAGGLVLALVLMLFTGGWPLQVALGVMAVGALYDLWRRARLARSPGGLWWALPLGLLVFAVLHLLGHSLPANCVLALGLAFGPLSHATKGVAHLAYHPRPDRFGRDAPVGAITPRLGDGVGQLADFRWTELLSFDACVSCGRCDDVCPALAAGQPLSPRNLIQGLISGRTEPDALWSCTTCAACVEACPMLIEHVDAVAGQRQGVVMREGTQPAPVAQATELARLRGVLTDENPAERWQWAVDQGVAVLEEGERCEVLLWLGQGALDTRHRRSLRALIEVLRRAGQQIAILGAAERDCGDIPLRTGDLPTFERLAHANIAALEARRFDRIVTADPHAAYTLGTEYQRRFGAVLPVEHHSATLRRLIESGALTLAPGAKPLAVHDPCYLGRYLGTSDDLSVVLRSTTSALRAPARSGRRTMCCGAGGGAALADIPGEGRIADLRMEQLRETGAPEVAVACPNCTVMLEGAGHALPVVDVAEAVLRALQTEDAP